MSWRRARRWLKRRKFLPIAGVAALAVVTLALVATAFAMPRDEVTAPEAHGSPLPTGHGPVLVQVIGDSYTGGSQMGGLNEKGWARIVAANYKGPGEFSLDLVAEGGAGYINKGLNGSTIPDFWAANGKRNQDVIVVFAGLNDSYQDPAAVGAAASAFYAQLKHASPKASLIVVGPAWPGVKPVKPSMPLIRDALKAAATTAGAQFVDPLADGWFAGADARMIGSDTTHPDDEGHAYMAAKLEPVIYAAVQKAATG